MRKYWPLFLVIGVYAVFAVCFASFTPYRQPGQLRTQRGADGLPAQVADVGAPDERQHANYVARLLHGEGFPRLDTSDPNLYENYQAHQPPAYYLLAAAWCKALGADPTHPPDGMKLRFLNILIGAGTVAFIFLAAWWGFGNMTLAFFASALTGWMPMFIALNAAVTNDSLLYLCCSSALALTILTASSGWNIKLAVWIGLIVGLGLLTKTTALALMPMLVVGIWLRRDQPQIKKFATVAIALPLIVAAGWWVRNMNLYGDPLAMSAFQKSFTGSAHRADLVQMIQGIGTDRELSPFAAQTTYWTQWFGWWTARSFIGAFGYMDIFLSAWWYALGLLTLVVLIACWLARIRSVDKAGLESKVYAISVTLFAVVLLLYLQFNLTYFQAQARYLYPAIGAIGVCLAGGTQAVPAKYRNGLIAACLGIVLLLDAISVLALREAFSGYSIASL